MLKSIIVIYHSIRLLVLSLFLISVYIGSFADCIIHLTGCPLRLEKLENEPFSELGWKSWKTIGFSSALAGQAEFVLGLIIINRIIL